MNPFTKIIAAVVIAVAIGAPVGAWQSGVIGGGGGGGGTNTANIWVVPSGAGSCARNPTQQTYAVLSARSCGGLNAAYAVANAGDLIDVKSGTYASEDLTLRSLGSSRVTFQGEPGQTAPTVIGLGIDTPYVTITGINFGDNGFGIEASHTVPLDVHDVTVENFTSGMGSDYQSYCSPISKCGSTFIKANNVLIQDGSIGPYHSCFGGTEDGVVLGVEGVSNATPSDNVTFNRVTIHDVDDWDNGVDGSGGSSCGGRHVDGMQWYGGTNITIENSKIYNTATSLILAGNVNNAAMDHILLQNNEFGSTLRGGNGVRIDPCNGSPATTDDMIFQNNTFYGGDGPASFCATGLSAIARNNVIIPTYVCTEASVRNFVYSYNVFSAGSSTCNASTGAKVCTPTFVDSSHANGNGDVVANNSCVLTAADPTSGHYPTTDINGATRPQGAGPDAGANEVG